MSKPVKERDLAQFFRVPVILPVDYDERELLALARISNISKNGVFIAVDKPLPVGSELEIRFQLPGERELVCVRAVVRWSAGSPRGERPVPGRQPGMGLEFEKLGRKQRGLIEAFIRRFIKEMRQA